MTKTCPSDRSAAKSPRLIGAHHARTSPGGFARQKSRGSAGYFKHHMEIKRAAIATLDRLNHKATC